MPFPSQFFLPSEPRVERGAGSVRVSFSVPEDFFFCQGHFPDQPIVPGAVVAAWMLEAARLAGEKNTPRRLQNLKFRHPLVPGDPVAVSAEAGASSVRVTVRSGERLCANAVFLP